MILLTIPCFLLAPALIQASLLLNRPTIYLSVDTSIRGWPGMLVTLGAFVQLSPLTWESVMITKATCLLKERRQSHSSSALVRVVATLPNSPGTHSVRKSVLPGIQPGQARPAFAVASISPTR